MSRSKRVKYDFPAEHEQALEARRKARKTHARHVRLGIIEKCREVKSIKESVNGL